MLPSAPAMIKNYSIVSRSGIFGCLNECLQRARAKKCENAFQLRTKQVKKIFAYIKDNDPKNTNISTVG